MARLFRILSVFTRKEIQNHPDYPLVIGVESALLIHFIWKIQLRLHPIQSSQLFVKFTYVMIVARKLNFGNILKELNRPVFSGRFHQLICTALFATKS